MEGDKGGVCVLTERGLCRLLAAGRGRSEKAHGASGRRETWRRSCEDDYETITRITVRCWVERSYRAGFKPMK